MSDLERFFQQLVVALAANDPARLNRPVTLGDIQDTILPYRSFRGALGVDTAEDYDLLLLRLAAGESGFARVSPEDVRARFAREVASPNPDLATLRTHADAWVSLEGLRVARAIAADDSAAFAPREPRPEAEPLLDGSRADPAARDDELDLAIAHPLPPVSTGPRPTLPEPAPMCLYCGATLPTGRTVNFCPSCGQSQTTPRCPQCQSEIEIGWRHCITCGAALAQV